MESSSPFGSGLKCGLSGAACTKTRNNETKPPKRNHRNERNDRNETTETTETIICFVSVVSVVSFRSFRSFRWFRFGGFVSLFRVLVHAVWSQLPSDDWMTR